jgi:hypothetical protein
MIMKNIKTISTPKHHAMLFTYIVKSAREEPGSEADEAVKKAVIEYAMQRGREWLKELRKMDWNYQHLII